MATRRERVVLDLEDNFTTGMMRAAAASGALANALDDVDDTSVGTRTSLKGTSKEVDNTGAAVRRAGPDIDKFSGRLKLLGQISATFGPSLIPIGAVGIPALTGVASALGFAAIAGGTAIAAFQGVGEALDAVNKAQLDPTEENLEAARQAMEDLSPAARDMVRELRGLIPELKELRDTAAEGMFPGLTRGLDGLENALPRVERIIDTVSTKLGEVAGDAGESLGSERWAPFLDFVADEAPEALGQLADITGNIGKTMANLWMAFDPLNDDALGWLAGATADLEKWSDSLSQTEGFQDFVDYIRETGPEVGETLGAIATAVVDILEAAAPLGGPALDLIEGIAKAVSAVADSDMGTPIFTALAAVSALNLALKSTRRLAQLATAPLGGVAFAGTGAGAGGGRDRESATAIPVRGDRDKKPDRKPSRRPAAPGAGTGLESIAWVVGAAAGLDYLDRKLADVGERGNETRAVLRDFDLPKEGAVNKFLFGESKNTLAADLDRVLDAKRFGGFFSGIEADMGRALGGTTFTKSLDNVQELDDQLFRVSKRNPGRAMDALLDVTKKTGLSTEELARALPKSSEALLGQARAAGDVGSLLRQTIPQLARYDKILRGFPKAAITEIATNGLPKTRREIVDLTSKYKLTPKQVSTLIRQKGGDPTKRMVRGIIDDAKALDRQKPNPRLSAKDDATRTIRKVGTELRTLDGDTATVSIFTKRVTTTVQEFFTRKNSAMGNLFLAERFAQGGFGDVANNHQPELAGPGQTRVWREPETQGEAYIPLANDYRRPRAQEIAAETVGLLGGVAYFADGGRRGPTRASGGGGRGGSDAAKGLAKLREELGKSRKVLEKERSVRESLISRRNDYASSVRDSFRSDPFARPENIWAAGAGDPLGVLRQDIRNASAFRGQIRRLKKFGLKGDALAEINSSEEAAAVIALGASGAKQYQSLFNQRRSISSSTGTAAGQAAFGRAIAESTKDVRRIAQIVARQEKTAAKRAKAMGKAAGQAVNKGATASKRKKRARG